jgi:hypothetical protein
VPRADPSRVGVHPGADVLGDRGVAVPPRPLRDAGKPSVRGPVNGPHLEVRGPAPGPLEGILSVPADHATLRDGASALQDVDRLQGAAQRVCVQLSVPALPLGAEQVGASLDVLQAFGQLDGLAGLLDGLLTLPGLGKVGVPADDLGELRV